MMYSRKGFTKRAVKREPAPVGMAANLYLDCECGQKLGLPIIAGMPMNFQCSCGLVYNAGGWIVARAHLQVIACDCKQNGTAHDVSTCEGWVCECGNVAAMDGFYPCDTLGVQMEPIPGWPHRYVCGRCRNIMLTDGSILGKSIAS